MDGWERILQIDSGSDKPLFLQVAAALGELIGSGRLKPGQRLPGSRRLAQNLSLHRNTVNAAYAELHSQGWITTRERSGHYVSEAIPAELPSQPRPQPDQAAYDLPPADPTPMFPRDKRGRVTFSAGFPDSRLIPTQEIARAFRRAISKRGARLLNYGDARGHPQFRQALSQMLSATRALEVDPERLLITRGSQMAIYLISRVLLRPGDLVAVEQLGYRPAWDALQTSGATLVPIDLDENGLQVEQLELLARSGQLKLVYLTPQHQYPTTVVLNPGRRIQLLELARRYRFAILEDDYDNEFHYDGRPIVPLASEDSAGSVIYVSTLSKILAPGLRVGAVTGPSELIERLTRYRVSVDSQGNLALEVALADLLESGDLQRHVRRVRRIYRARRDHLVSGLRSQLDQQLTFQVPSGGIALWARVNDSIDPVEWARRGAERGLYFRTAADFAFDRQPRPFIRLGFAPLNHDEIDRAVADLARSVP